MPGWSSRGTTWRGGAHHNAARGREQSRRGENKKKGHFDLPLRRGDIPPSRCGGKRVPPVPPVRVRVVVRNLGTRRISETTAEFDDQC